MIGGILGFLILLGVIVILGWAIFAILEKLGIPIHPVVRIVAIAVIGIVLLVLLAQVLGIQVPSLR